VFTDDNPLNAEDPLGLDVDGVGFSIGYGGGVTGDAGAVGLSDEGSGGDGESGEGEADSTKGEDKGEDKLNEEQQKNLKRFEKSLPKGAEDIKVTKLPNGNVKFQAKVPASNVPGSYTEYFKIVEEDGETAPDGWYHDTYDQNGDFVHRHF
jgi:hypothetical protein